MKKAPSAAAPFMAAMVKASVADICNTFCATDRESLVGATHTTTSDPDRSHLARYVTVIVRDVKRAHVGQCGEPTNAWQFSAHGHRLSGLGNHLSIQKQLCFHANEVARKVLGNLICMRPVKAS